MTFRTVGGQLLDPPVLVFGPDGQPLSLAAVLPRTNGVGNPTFRKGSVATPLEVRRNLLSARSNLGGVPTDGVSWGGGTWTQVVTASPALGLRYLATLASLVNGGTYTISGEVANPGATTIGITLDWCDGAPTGTVTLAPGQSAIVSTTVTRATYDATYRFADFCLNAAGTFLIRNVMIEKASALLPYFDGSSPVTPEGWTCSWLGAVGGSESVMRAPSISQNAAPYSPVVGGPVNDAEGPRMRYLWKGDAANLALWAFQTDATNPVSAGEYRAMRLEVRQVGAVRGFVSVIPRIGYYDASAFVHYLAGSPAYTVPTDGSWLPLSIPSSVAASGAGISARVMLYRGVSNPAPTPGQMIEVRNVIIEPVSGTGVEAGPYFDGQAAPTLDHTYAWQGAPDASASVASP